MIKKLSKQEIFSLNESLHFFHVSELKALCHKLSLLEKGKKTQLIDRIVKFVETGEKLALPKMPKVSCAQKGQIYKIETNSLMLKNNYKNDLKTRLFFKSIIGDHFHYTAYGIDWLNQRWFDGKPPTYQEFANMWKKEYEQRSKVPAPPKAEWAYINFVQKYLLKHPSAAREDIINKWEAERHKNKNKVRTLLNLEDLI